MVGGSGDAFGFVGTLIEPLVRVDAEVGEGGFSIVYRGRHLGLNEDVAVKCMKLPAGLRPPLVIELVDRFRAESRISYRLSQGSLDIVRSISSGAALASSGAVVPYIVLEWLNGNSLGQDLKLRMMNGAPPRSLAEVTELFDPAARALDYAHKQGVVHRDVKPGNLFLADTREGVRLKVLDFGLAKLVDPDGLGILPLAQTLGNMAVCSPGYGAPEQLDPRVRGDRPVDRRLRVRLRRARGALRKESANGRDAGRGRTDGARPERPRHREQAWSLASTQARAPPRAKRSDREEHSPEGRRGVLGGVHADRRPSDRQDQGNRSRRPRKGSSRGDAAGCNGKGSRRGPHFSPESPPERRSCNRRRDLSGVLDHRGRSGRRQGPGRVSSSGGGSSSLWARRDGHHVRPAVRRRSRNFTAHTGSRTARPLASSRASGACSGESGASRSRVSAARARGPCVRPERRERRAQEAAAGRHRRNDCLLGNARPPDRGGLRRVPPVAMAPARLDVGPALSGCRLPMPRADAHGRLVVRANAGPCGVGGGARGLATCAQEEDLAARERRLPSPPSFVGEARVLAGAAQGDVRAAQPLVRARDLRSRPAHSRPL